MIAKTLERTREDGNPDFKTLGLNADENEFSYVAVNNGSNAEGALVSFDQERGILALLFNGQLQEYVDVRADQIIDITTQLTDSALSDIGRVVHMRESDA